MPTYGPARTPGNTIRKVYLCRAKITRLRPGDILVFYMSKDPNYAAPQSITTVGIVEQVANVATAEELIRQTAKRSVFSADDLTGMEPSRLSPVKLIDFLLAGHSEPAVGPDYLVTSGVFTSKSTAPIHRRTIGRAIHRFEGFASSRLRHLKRVSISTKW